MVVELVETTFPVVAELEVAMRAVTELVEATIAVRVCTYYPKQ